VTCPTRAANSPMVNRDRFNMLSTLAVTSSTSDRTLSARADEIARSISPATPYGPGVGENLLDRPRYPTPRRSSNFGDNSAPV
jgi:hypothetical protein